jgi:hypothetical protein
LSARESDAGSISPPRPRLDILPLAMSDEEFEGIQRNKSKSLLKYLD